MTWMKQAVVGAFLLIGWLFSVGGIPAQAAELQCRNIEYIVGWGAGGGSDTFARSIVPSAGKILGIPIKVLNMPGGSSIMAMQEVLNRPADGCTLFGITTDQVTNEATGLTKLSYRDLTPIIRAHIDVGMFHAKGDGQFKSWDDVVSFAKENPGKLLVGGTGAASFDEIVATILLDGAGLKFRYIPYESASDMHADLLGGRLHIMYDEISVMAPMIESGMVLPVMVFADKRLERFPSVVSAGGKGYPVPPAIWRGIAVNKGTPAPVVSALEAAFLEAAKSAKYQEFAKGRLLNLFPGLLGSKDFLPILEQELAMYKKVLKK